MLSFPPHLLSFSLSPLPHPLYALCSARSAADSIAPSVMRGMRLCVYLALMLVLSGLCQGRGFGDLREQLEEEGKRERGLVALSILNRNRVPGSLQRPQLRPPNRKNRLQRPTPLAPKRNPQGPRFALSLGCPHQHPQCPDRPGQEP